MLVVSHKPLSTTKKIVVVSGFAQTIKYYKKIVVVSGFTQTIKYYKKIVYVSGFIQTTKYYKKKIYLLVISDKLFWYNILGT